MLHEITLLCVPLLAVCIQVPLIFTRLLFILYHYIFRPNRPSSGVQFVVAKESAGHCNAVLLSLCNCLGLIIGYVSYRAVTMHVFALSAILELYFKMYICVGGTR
jgi:hypothetical protein